VAVACALDPGASRADTVELRNGQRIEGTLREANATSVVIESGGRAVVLPRADVSTIHFAAPAAAPSTPPSVARSEVFQALDGLRGLTRSQPVKQAAYTRAVADAKVALDRYLQEPGGDPAFRALVGDAYALYAVASSAWEAKATHNANLSIGVGQDPVLERCAGLGPLLAKHPAPTDRGAALRRGVAMEAAIPTLWDCAAERVGEVERAIR
jgi:hypothetical protein